MNYRKLRITWSVVCGILCILLIALWVRSYWWLDDVSFGAVNGPGYKFISLRGELLGWRYSTRRGAVAKGWHHGAVAATEFKDSLSERGHNKFLGFSTRIDGGRPYMAVLPQWFAVGLVGACAVAPWISLHRLQFSLRAILIATTLVAAGLGAAAMMLRGS